MEMDFEATLASYPAGGAVQQAEAPRRTWRDALLGAVRRRRDAQTGLLTLDALVERGEPLIARSRRAQGALAVFDFPGLAGAPKVYGRDAGDRLLLLIARELGRLASRTGIVARTGPVRFAVVLPGVTLQEAVDAVH